jgi:hypothetical protein
MSAFCCGYELSFENQELDPAYDDLKKRRFTEMKKLVKLVLCAAFVLTANSALSSATRAFDGPQPMCVPPVVCGLR